MDRKGNTLVHRIAKDERTFRRRAQTAIKVANLLVEDKRFNWDMTDLYGKTVIDILEASKWLENEENHFFFELMIEEKKKLAEEVQPLKILAASMVLPIKSFKGKLTGILSMTFIWVMTINFLNEIPGK